MRTIYYAHDQQSPPSAIAGFLQQSGYLVELFPSADALLQRMSHQTPSLVLIDVLIEGPNGFELCRELRRQHPPEVLPIILQSAIYRSRIFREEGMHAGAQMYLLKPVQFEELAGMIHELIDANACLLSAHPPEADPDDLHSPEKLS